MNVFEPMDSRKWFEAENEETVLDCTRIIKEIIWKIRQGGLCPGDKLPPERKLCAQYDASPYRIRLVLDRLKKAGVLYSVPKIGVFVAEETLLDQEGVSGKGTRGNDDAVLSIETLSTLSLQEEFWNFSLEKYRLVSGLGKAEMIFQKTGIQRQGDVMEYGSLYENLYRQEEDFLDLKKNFSGCLSGISDSPHSYALPVYYVFPVILWNRDILESLGCGLPCYSDIGSQISFCEEVVVRAVSAGYQQPEISQQPILHLVGYLRKMLEDLQAGPEATEDTFCARYLEIIRENSDFCKRMKISFLWGIRENYFKFVSGKMPFFLGLSTDLIRLRENPPFFRYCASGAFAIDNTEARIFTYLCVKAATKLPLEALRYLKIMESDEMQKRLAVMGNLPARMEARNMLSEDILDLTASAEHYDFVFHSRKDYYLAVNLINCELLNILHHGKSSEEALHDIYQYGSIYLNL